MNDFGRGLLGLFSWPAGGRRGRQSGSRDGVDGEGSLMVPACLRNQSLDYRCRCVVTKVELDYRMGVFGCEGMERKDTPA